MPADHEGLPVIVRVFAMSGEQEVVLEWQLGDVILDLYEVREVVRSGGMGLVYRVLHRGWNVELAVKAPRRELASSPSGARNFELNQALANGHAAFGEGTGVVV